MKLSIVIPMYNEERYIARCLDSLKEQTYTDTEVILIDDGSTDKTMEIASRYEVTILKQEHGGPGKARNLGASKANGEILIFVDADMKFDKDYLKNLVQPILDGKEVGTAHGTEKVANIENIWARCWSVDRIPNPPLRGGVYRAILKSEFLKAGGFDSSKGYFDDALSIGQGALTVREAVCYHNNPETLEEAFNHSAWVGKSLVQSGAWRGYIMKYRWWVLGFMILSLIFLYRMGIMIVVGLGIVFLILAEIKAIQRSISEQFWLYPIYLPILFLARGLGYGWGAIKYLIK